MLIENAGLNLPTPPLFGASVGVTPLEFRRDFWRQKTRVPSGGRLQAVITPQWLQMPKTHGQMPPYGVSNFHFWQCLRDPVFSRFGIYSAGLWQSDGRTDTRWQHVPR